MWRLNQIMKTDYFPLLKDYRVERNEIKTDIFDIRSPNINSKHIGRFNWEYLNFISEFFVFIHIINFKKRTAKIF